MADPYRITDDWQEGYDAGYESGYRAASSGQFRDGPFERAIGLAPSKKKRKKPQKGKAKLLTDMTAPKWKKYKKGNGKKTYVDIRAQVSRSQDYKKACKRKGFK